MKKVLSLMIALLLAVSCVSAAAAESAAADSFGAYDHVFIIGVDGAGRFFNEAQTPAFDRIFANGAVDYTARTETISTSAQNWGAILCGVSYLRHGMTNSILSKTPRTSDTKYPSVFKYVRRAYPDAALASIVNWNAINVGLIETDLDVYKANYGSDADVTDAVCEYFNAGNAPKLFFCHFDEVDHVGHDKGSKAPEFIRQIEIADGFIGRIYDTLAANGLMENGLFIVVSDHGHRVVGGHGGQTMRETNTTVAAVGKTVAAGGKLDKDTRNRDVSAIALYALGIERPDYMSSRIPANLFNGVPGEKRPVRNELLDTLISRLAWPFTLCTAGI